MKNPGSTVKKMKGGDRVGIFGTECKEIRL